MVILFYLLPLLFIYVFAAIYTKWQIIDEDDGPGWRESDSKWHKAGLKMRVLLGLAMLGWCFPIDVSAKHFIVLLPLMASSWDIFINIARGRKWNDVGTGGWDAKVGQKKWIYYGIWLGLSITTAFLWKYCVLLLQKIGTLI